MSKAQEILSQLRNIDSELASYAYIDGDEADFQVRRLQREKKRLESMLAAPPAQDSDHEFKNFHRLLCERFGYTHDEVDWKRDQISLIEWIAKQVKPAAPVQEPAKRVCSLGCKNLSHLTTAMLLTFGVMAVSGLAVMLLDHLKKPLPSTCPELIEQHQATGVPAHLKIKCKEFLT